MPGHSLDEWDPRRGRGGRPYERLKKVIYAREICWLCGKPVNYDVPPRHPLAPSVDHVIPLHPADGSPGGHPTAIENAQLAHYGCNSARGNGSRRPDATEQPRPKSRNY
jgi:5-methylcytosine-specific restriction endonuclease McrA